MNMHGAPPSHDSSSASGRGSVQPSRCPLETGQLERPEVLAHHVDRDVVDRHALHGALKGASVGVAMDDKIWLMLGDRPREPIAAEHCEDARRLALERRL